MVMSPKVFFPRLQKCCLIKKIVKWKIIQYFISHKKGYIPFRHQTPPSIWSLVHTNATNGSPTAHKWFANQMCVCVDGTANLHCAICEWFAYHSPRTKTCQFFVQTQRELDASGVLSMHQMPFARLRFAEN